jgi:hypothetical protein
MANTKSRTEKVTIELTIVPPTSTSGLTSSEYGVVCPFGCEYSANPGDHWQGGDKPLTCRHEDADGFISEEYCDLIRRVYAYGEMPDGGVFSGHIIYTVIESVTPDDILRLVPRN